MGMGNGVDISPWKVKKITAPSNMTVSTEIKAWLETDGVIPSCEFGILIVDKPRTQWAQNMFTICPIINGSVTSWNGTVGTYYRSRGVSYASQYLQSRTITNTDDCIINQGDTFTIFYL